MTTPLWHYTILAALLMGCGETAMQPPTGKLALTVAPLGLTGVDVACYDLSVSNGSDVVWSRGVRDARWPADTTTLCSDRYGNGAGGDLAYVGTCDASGPDTDGDGRGERMNSVTLWLDGLYAGGNDVGDYRDPCRDGCTLEVPCEENEDQRVSFDLTVLRAANQGFFDVAVTFDDIFCSSKLDTCRATDAGPVPIELLFGDDGRDHTAVFGFACSAGPGTDVATTLLYGRVAVTCGDVVFELDPTLAPGNQTVTSGDRALRVGIYRGAEALACGGAAGSCNKLYWNLAFNLDDLTALGGDCTLSLEATAANGVGGFVAGLPAAAGLAYPYVVVDALPLTEVGAAACQENPLDGEDRWNGRASRVVTAYRGSLGGVAAPVPMCWRFGGASVAATDADAVACGAVCTDCEAPFVALSQMTDFAPGFLPDSATFIIGDDLLFQQDNTLHRVVGDGVVDIGNDQYLYLVHEPHFVRTGNQLVTVDGQNRVLVIDDGTNAFSFLTPPNAASSWFKAELAGAAILNVDLDDGHGMELYRYDPLGGFALLADLTADATSTIDCSQFDGRPIRCEENGCTFENGECLGGILEVTVPGQTLAIGGSFLRRGSRYFCIQHQLGPDVVGYDLVKTDGTTLTTVRADTAFCGDEFQVDGDRVYTIAIRDWAGGENLLALDFATDPPTETVLGTGVPYGQELQRASDGRLVAIGRRPDNLLTIVAWDGQTLAPLDATLIVAGQNLRVIGQRAYFAKPWQGCTDCGQGGNLDNGQPRAARAYWLDLAAPAVHHVIDHQVVPGLNDLYGTYREWESYAGNQALFALGDRIAFTSYTDNDGVVVVVSDGTAAGSRWFKTNSGTNGAPFARYGMQELQGDVWFNNYDATGAGQVFRLALDTDLPTACADGSHRDLADTCSSDLATCFERDAYSNVISGTQRYAADLWSACGDRSCAATEADGLRFDAVPGPLASGTSGIAEAIVFEDHEADPAVNGRLRLTYEAPASCDDSVLQVGAATLVATSVDRCAGRYYRAAPGDAFCSPVPPGFCHFPGSPPEALEPVEEWFGPFMLQNCN